MSIIKHCKICGNEIILKPTAAEHRASNYCSRECYAKARQKIKIINCIYCNKEIEVSVPYEYYTKFCSDECVENYNKDLDAGKIKGNKNRWHKSNCQTCGNEYWKLDPKSKYCNANCKPSKEYTLICQYCNQEFTTKRKESKFCSVSCGSKYNSKLQCFGTKVKPNTVWNKGLTKENSEKVKEMSKKIAIGNSNAIMNGRKINTQYKTIRPEGFGHVVRSTWEYNFAKILRYLNRQYKYENERFILSDGRTYIPDFYDIKRDCYYEIKGYFHDDAKAKLELFKKDYPYIKLRLIDTKKYLRIKKIFETKIKWE